jgi:phospholipid transport system transporter-binding protein
MMSPGASIDFSTAAAVSSAGLTAIAGGEDRFDFTGLVNVDSSAVATLIGWQREARKRGRSLQFLNVPANLAQLADLYEVDELFGIGGASAVSGVVGAAGAIDAAGTDSATTGDATGAARYRV